MRVPLSKTGLGSSLRTSAIGPGVELLDNLINHQPAVPGSKTVDRLQDSDRIQYSDEPLLVKSQ